MTGAKLPFLMSSCSALGMAKFIYFVGRKDLRLEVGGIGKIVA